MRRPVRGADLAARREMAGLLRKFAAGHLSVDEYEKAFEDLLGVDEAVDQAYFFTWYHYCDFKTETLTGDWALSKESRRVWARWVLYLLTDTSTYESLDLAPRLWPHLAWIAATAVLYFVKPGLNLIVLPAMWLWNRVAPCVYSKFPSPTEPPHYWPFASESALSRATALKNPFKRAA